ncbi:MAG: Vps62-related protein [Candidatus Omnitrophica bacterium]|nr:Vps62-related protein [Candidatus Omnitrophota bacterium]
MIIRAPTYLIILLFCLASLTSMPGITEANTYVVYSNDFSRLTSQPVALTEQFASIPQVCTIFIFNGGKSQQYDAISSAVIDINGSPVTAPNEFNQNQPIIVKTIELSDENQLSVDLRSKPGGGITIEIIGIDDDPPVIVVIPTPAPNSAGWNNTDVTVNFVCSDATSGIASCPPPVIVQEEGENQKITGEAEDNAGNTASAEAIVNIDKTAPVVTITSPLQGAIITDSPVTVKGTVEEHLSGVAEMDCNGDPLVPAPTSSFICNVSLVKGENMIEVAATDLAGNTGTSEITVIFDPPALELSYVEDLELIWWNPSYWQCGGLWVEGLDWVHFGAFYRPIAPEGYYALGHYGELTSGGACSPSPQPAGFMLSAKELEPGALAKPLDYIELWKSTGAMHEPPGSFWRPVPPDGYVSLGIVAQNGHNKPDLDQIRCVREDLTTAGMTGRLVWNTERGIGSEMDLGLWQVKAQDPGGIGIGAFVGSNSTTVQPDEPLYCIDVSHVKDGIDDLNNLGSQEVAQLVEKYGPILLLNSNEIFLPDGAEYSLNFAKLEWGLVQNEWDYDSFNLQILGSIPTSSEILMDDFTGNVETDPDFSNAEFRHWLRMPVEWGYPFTTGEIWAPGSVASSGDLSRARAYVRVLPWNWLFTELQFWIYYPFNGPGRVRVCLHANDCHHINLWENGRHYSDWEHVTLRILNSTKELVGVYMSAHAGGYWFLTRDFGGRLMFSETHPKVYAAKFSHAQYAAPGRHFYKRVKSEDWGLGTFSVDLYDDTDNGPSLPVYQPAYYSVISSAMPGYPVIEPDWILYHGRWGQYERLSDTVMLVYTQTEVGAGPFGPVTKDCWGGEPDGPGSW